MFVLHLAISLRERSENPIQSQGLLQGIFIWNQNYTAHPCSPHGNFQKGLCYQIVSLSRAMSTTPRSCGCSKRPARQKATQARSCNNTVLCNPSLDFCWVFSAWRRVAAPSWQPTKRPLYERDFHRSRWPEEGREKDLQSLLRRGSH